MTEKEQLLRVLASHVGLTLTDASVAMYARCLEPFTAEQVTDGLGSVMRTTPAGSRRLPSPSDLAKAVREWGMAPARPETIDRLDDLAALAPSEAARAKASRLVELVRTVHGCGRDAGKIAAAYEAHAESCPEDAAGCRRMARRFRAREQRGGRYVACPECHGDGVRNLVATRVATAGDQRNEPIPQLVNSVPCTPCEGTGEQLTATYTLWRKPDGRAA